MSIDTQKVHELLQHFLGNLEDYAKIHGDTLTAEAKVEVSEWIRASKKRSAKLEGGNG